MAPNIGEAINMHIAYEHLFGDNKAFCDQFGCKRVITIETRITHAPEIQVVQIQHFTDDQVRDFSVVNVFPDSLTVKAVSGGIIIITNTTYRATEAHLKPVLCSFV